MPKSRGFFDSVGCNRLLSRVFWGGKWGAAKNRPNGKKTIGLALAVCLWLRGKERGGQSR